MKVPVVLTAFVVAASTASAYVCPSPTDVAFSCKQLNVFPLVCYNPNMNKEACNAKQCNQKYIDYYAACQCRRTTSNFYEHSRNVNGLIKRCGGGLNNPYGDPNQYQPGGGSGTTSTPASRIPTSVATVITRTHTNNPAVTTAVGTTTAQPIVAPTGIPISTQSSKMSGGAIAGTVLGILGALGLAGLLGWCWRRSRAAHVPIVSSTTRVGHGATRTVVSEKIEPLVIKSVNADQTYHAASVPVAATAAGVGAAAGAAGGSAYASQSQPAGSSTSYTTTTSSGVPAAGAGTAGTSGTAGGAAYGSRSQPTSSNYTTTASDVPAVTASHVQPGTTHSTTTGQSGDKTIYSSSTGYNPKPRN